MLDQISNNFVHLAHGQNEQTQNTNQLAKPILDIATEKIENNQPTESTKNPAAVALGKLRGIKGGKVRADSLTPEQRKEIAKKATERVFDKED